MTARTYSFGFLSLVVLLAINVSSHAIVNGTPPDEDDRRWDAVCAFVHFATPDPPITGECPEGPPTSAYASSASGVLITPNKVITARHAVVQAFCGTANECVWFKFRRKTDGTLGDFYAKVASWEIATCLCPPPGDLGGGVCDVAIATLETSITHIKPIRVDLDPDLSDTDSCRPEPSTETYVALAGWGRNGSTNPNTGLCDPIDIRILRRTPIAGVNAGVTPLKFSIPGSPSSFTPCASQADCPASGFVASQCSISLYDSGGAILFEDPQTCELRLIGVIAGGVAGNPRLDAHDALPDGLTIPVYSGCPADLNYDGVVGHADLQILRAAAGDCPCPTCLDPEPACCSDPALFCPADLNHDCDVTMADAAILIAAMGNCPS